MKNRLIPLLFLLLSIINMFAQKKVYVLDSVTKNILPFAEVAIGKSGVYTNEKGFFIVKNDTFKKATIHFLGYKSRLVNLSKLDTVLLIPKQYELDEVTLSAKKEKITIDFLKIKKRFFGSFPLGEKTEILTIITPKNKALIGNLEKVSFKFKKVIFNKKKYSKTSKAFIRLNIYANDSTQVKIFASKMYEVKKTKKNIITFNLSESNIEFSKDGLVFGIEYIGHTDENGNFIENSNMNVRMSLAAEESDLYKQITFLRSVFNKEIIIKSFYNNFYSLDHKKLYNRNLSISFVVKK